MILKPRIIEALPAGYTFAGMDIVDTANIFSIIRATRKDPEAANRFVRHHFEAAKDGEARYFVIRDDHNRTFGLCGLKHPDARMNMIKSNSHVKAIEIVDLFIAEEERGKGYGEKLLIYTVEQAAIAGYDEVVFNAGPEYTKDRLHLLIRLFGEPTGIIPEYYGNSPDGDTPVWRYGLTDLDKVSVLYLNAGLTSDVINDDTK